MGRESINDQVVSAQSSSIALLKERFRQLERMKEMREERELLRKRVSPPSRLLLFHLLTAAPRPRSSSPTDQVPNLSLWSSGSMSHAAAPSSGTLGCMDMETPLFALLPTVMGTPSSTSLHVDLDKFRGSDCCDDVDTSLHL
ncbi:hypothetical protein like AT4G16447 [Hibiscus trionum]|uniref:Uncharacterized protein n=1 Tax=Hibiscus trionum TaxID=183268 RepID=A0A9W7JKC7_HIBTR|nr:hypothetical protein like AT4G16447 [Hibiscus trionum]